MLLKCFMLVFFFAIQGEAKFGGSHSKENHGFPPSIFPFLKNTTAEQKKDFYTIIANTTATKGEKKTAADNWAQNIGGDVQTSYTEFQANLSKIQTETRANVSRIISELPNELTEVYKILDDQTVTEKQEIENLIKFYNSIADPEMKSALQFILAPRFPLGPRGPHGKKHRRQ
ncbi:unnamed protein product, partial [Mesorhabditis belari]|uniref:SXP/RAL-2 family protein Ani s 5-like cation-binding domain-containing protein n=1 Tax=Mesorhabditis belari TaxID=2138241 RepID=A0AAF3EF35_9BILA